MKKTPLVFIFLIILVALISHTVYAEEERQSTKPWSKLGISFGGFLNALDSSVSLGTKGIGVEVDVEDALGIDTETAVFRLEGYWRFTKNMRHRFDLSWFAIRRDGTKTLLEDFEVGDTVFPAQTKIESNFDLDIFRLSYSYSFFQDDRMDLAVSGGLFIMPLSFSIKAEGLFEGEESADITAPLPAVGLRFDFAITPKWLLRNHFDVFYIKIGSFKGGIMNFGSAIEWAAFKNVGFGLGIDSFRMGVEAEDENDYPGVDFKGTATFQYTGLMLYVKASF